MNMTVLQAQSDTIRPAPNAHLKLNAIWERERVLHGFVQQDMADFATKHGFTQRQSHSWSQSTVSQYLSGKITLNPQALLAFALFLKVDPSSIDENLGRYLAPLGAYKRKPLAIRKKDMLQEANRLIAASTSDRAYIVRADKNFGHRIQRGDWLVINPERPTKSYDLVIVWYAAWDYVFGYLRKEADTITLINPIDDREPEQALPDVKEVSLVESILINPEF